MYILSLNTGAGADVVGGVVAGAGAVTVTVGAGAGAAQAPINDNTNTIIRPINSKLFFFTDLPP